MLQAADKNKVTKSISDLGRRVTAADVSTKTGLPVLLVSQALNQIASETGGHLAVSQAGDLVYSFPLGFANKYLTHGFRNFVEKTCEQAFKIGFFLLKISFGVMLVLSFSIIVITFFVIFRSQQKGTNKARTPEIGRFLDYVLVRDILFYIASPAASPVRYDYMTPTVRRREKSNFFLDCFSFLFGDGDPNEGLDEKRWQLVAKVIKQHNNVVTAEQLAPYTGADPKNEDGALPVLVRFNGKPEVTETGNIVYTFPSLAVTTGSDHLEKAPPFLKEFPWKFSELEARALRPIYWVSALNFAGAWSFWLIFHSPGSSLTALFTTMAVYGTLFLMVPLLRWISLGLLNKRIEDRNRKRAESAELLLSPSEDLRKKIVETREYRLKDKLIGKGGIVYTTEQAALDQEDELSLQFKPGDTFDAKPEETFDASPND